MTRVKRLALQVGASAVPALFLGLGRSIVACGTERNPQATVSEYGGVATVRRRVVDYGCRFRAALFGAPRAQRVLAQVLSASDAPLPAIEDVAISHRNLIVFVNR